MGTPRKLIDPKTGKPVEPTLRRTSKDKARDTTLSVYTSAAHRTYIQQAARIQGMSVSSFVEYATLAWIRDNIAKKRQ